MKKFGKIFAVCIFTIFLTACAIFETYPNYKFVGKKTYFLDFVQGLNNFPFDRFDNDLISKTLDDEIGQIMKQKGYERVFSKEEADFTMLPNYFEWKYPEPYGRRSGLYNSVNDTEELFYPKGRTYLELAIYAKCKNSASRDWIGNSVVYKIDHHRYTIYEIRIQAREVLKEFPNYLEKLENNISK